MSKISDEDWFAEQYLKEGKDIGDVADEADVTYFKAAKWARRHDFSDYDQCDECGDYFKNLSAHVSVHEEEESDE